MATKQDFVEYAEFFTDGFFHRPRKELTQEKFISDALSVLEPDEVFIAALNNTSWLRDPNGKSSLENVDVGLVVTSRGLHLIPSLWNMKSITGKLFQKLAIGDGEPLLLEWDALKGIVNEYPSNLEFKFSIPKAIRGGLIDEFYFSYGLIQSSHGPAKRFVDLFKEGYTICRNAISESESSTNDEIAHLETNDVHAASTATEDIQDQIQLIERLTVLLEKGAITKDEFDLKKKEILGL